MRLITLTTDFGTRDWFVGTMKGVILGINPRASIVDLTHEIPAGDIQAAAFAVRSAAPCFPAGTIHVVVVDPGVGGPRRAIAVRTTRGIFLGPDNGLLSLAVARDALRGVRELSQPRWFLPAISRTFHGRDIFSPVAAHLSRGIRFERLGPEIARWTQLTWPAARRSKAGLVGEIVYVDCFGNAITNLTEQDLPGKSGAGAGVFVRDRRLCPVKEFYQAVPRGSPVAVVGSTGLLEIAVNGGSAALRHGLRPGQEVTVRSRGQSHSSASR